MITPICDFVENYIGQGTSRFHMPGHKGTCPQDITEIKGADDLYHADGIIAESERNASVLFGSRSTFYSTEGSSLCIRAMLYLALTEYRRTAAADTAVNSAPASHCISSGSAESRGPVGTTMRPTVLAARNAHKTFLYTCALLDLNVEWIRPESLCSCPVTPEKLTETLERHITERTDLPFAVFVTSPDYLGGTQEIAGLSKVCHQYGIPLLVDHAHGAYERFLTPSVHPMDLGADLCCDSAHKTLPALTGTAYLHVGKEALYPYEKHAKEALALFGSTSPSYLLLQSLDRCNAILAEEFSARLTACIYMRNAVCKTLTQTGYVLRPSDPLRIVFEANAIGCSGEALADHFRAHQIECEYADCDYVVLMVAPNNTDTDWERLASLPFPNAACSNTDKKKTETVAPTISKPVCSIREALFAPSIRVPLDQAVGKICAAPTVSCPPAIPLAISGERITKETVSLCRTYGIDSILVLQ